MDLTHDIDWSDPEARLRLIERIGPDAYSVAFEAHRKATVIETVNGYDIRPVQTRFGQLFQIDALPTAFATIEQARECANGAPARI